MEDNEFLSEEDIIFLTINTQSIDVELLNQSFDPSLVSRYNTSILGIDIWKRYSCIAQPALLFAGQVTVIDRTILVIL